MHIQLTRENTEKMLKWSTETNHSVGEIVNLIVASVEQMEISQDVKVEAVSDGTPAKKQTYRRRSSWSVGI